MIPIVAALAKSGLSLLANAFLVKGRDWVEKKIGTPLPADDTAALSPADTLKLKEAQLAHDEELARLRLEDDRLSVELDKAYLADRQSARERDVAFINAGRKNERGDVLAYAAVFGLLGVTIILLFVEPSAAQKEILLVVLGALIKTVGDVYAFEFGSSKGEAKKDNAMTKWLDEQ